MKKQLQVLVEQQESICNLLERTLYTEEMFLKRNVALSVEVKDLKQSIEEVEETCHNKNELDRVKELFLPVAVHVPDCYEKMTVEEKNQLWKLLMEKITYIVIRRIQTA